MSTYRKIHGRSIQAVTTDPSESVAEGQVWYNTTSDTFKSVLNIEAFTSSSPYITGRRSFGSAGTQTANVIFAGAAPNSNATEEYNGSGWASGGDFGASGYGVRGMGTQTAALSAGLFTPGGVQTSVYEYDGSSWTAGGGLPAARAVQGTAGTQTAGLAFGGSTGPFVNTINSTYEYDGSSWTAGNNLNTGRTYLAGIGIQTAAVGCGGYTGSPAASTVSSATEEYDGTNWTSSGNMTVSLSRHSSSGLQTAGLSFGGSPTPTAGTNCQKYDGSTWANSSATLGTANFTGGGSPAGSQSAALNTEGGSSPYGLTTEEFNSSTNIITAATFSSGGNTNVAGQARSPASGTQTASTIVGANQGPPSWYSNVTEHYNGSSWTNGGNYPTNAGYLINEGTETATIAAFNGYYPGSSPFQTPTASNEYNGSSWTSGNSYAGSARYGVGAFGTQTAALAACGSIVPADSQVQSDIYDGTNWTSGPNAVNERQRTCGTGILTAGIIGAGYASTPSPTSVNYATASNIEEYDGSSFSNSGAVLFNQAWQQGVFGTATSAIFFGGNNSPSGISAANEFNGTICVTAPNMANARTGGGGGGTTTAGLACSGSPPSSLPSGNKTEEFTGEIVTANVKTLTQS